MPASNPYQPPDAAVADVGTDVEAGWQPVDLFTWRGRIGRARFIAYSVWGYLLCIPAMFLLTMIAVMAGFPAAGIFVGLAVFLPYAVFVVFASIQRSHDMDWSGWTTLLMLIPFVPFVWMAKGGSAGRNRYGLPPPPNSLSVKIGAWMMLVLIVGGVLLAVAAVEFSRQVDAGAKKAQQQRQLQEQQQPAK
jgi:uncharacterized membrane protein YhaH (DUF805 family)